MNWYFQRITKTLSVALLEFNCLLGFIWIIQKVVKLPLQYLCNTFIIHYTMCLHFLRVPCVIILHLLLGIITAYMYFDSSSCLFPWEICYILQWLLKQWFNRQQRITNILKSNNTKNLDIIRIPNQQRKKKKFTAKTKPLSCKLKPYCQ